MFDTKSTISFNSNHHYSLQSCDLYKLSPHNRLVSMAVLCTDISSVSISMPLEDNEQLKSSLYDQIHNERLSTKQKSKEHAKLYKKVCRESTKSFNYALKSLKKVVHAEYYRQQRRIRALKTVGTEKPVWYSSQKPFEAGVLQIAKNNRDPMLFYCNGMPILSQIICETFIPIMFCDDNQHIVIKGKKKCLNAIEMLLHYCECMYNHNLVEVPNILKKGLVYNFYKWPRLGEYKQLVNIVK